MKLLRLALPTAMLTIIPGLTAHAQGAAVSKQELDAKLAYCKTCHGANGQGYHGAYPIPRLAGQQPEYFENQLHAFIDRRRENKFMYSVAHVLSPAMLPALAAHFKDLNPAPLGGAPKELIPTGKKIYEEGFPNADIPPCANCHGPGHHGADRPRLDRAANSGGRSLSQLSAIVPRWTTPANKRLPREIEASLSPIMPGLDPAS